jgi:hypothetical protein
VTKTGKLLALAFSRREFKAKVCSMAPLIPLKNPFCVEVSMMWFETRNLSRRFAMILWNSFPMQLVRAIGLKFDGRERLPALWISLMLPVYQLLGPGLPWSRILVNKVAKKWWQLGRWRKWQYEMESGPGAEDAEHFWSVIFTVWGVMGERSKSDVTSGGGMTSSEIHSGSPWYLSLGLEYRLVK